jgi:hypothetical protein
VSWHTQTSCWKAQIKVAGKDVNLGRHRDEMKVVSFGRRRDELEAARFAGTAVSVRPFPFPSTSCFSMSAFFAGFAARMSGTSAYRGVSWHTQTIC